MSYVAINKSGCGIHKNRAKLRLDFFLSPNDPNYERCPDSPFHSHFIYPDKDASDADIKAEIEKCINYFYAFHQHCWDKELKFIDEWKKVPSQAGQVRCPFIKGEPENLKANEGKVQNILSRVQEFQVGVSKVPPQNLNIGEKGTIDVGSAAIDREQNVAGPMTLIDGNNPANATGTIDTIEIYSNTIMYDTEVATFIDEGSDVFSTRDSETLGTVSSGYRDFTGLDMDVSTDDDIGVYFSGGKIEKDAGGNSWTKSADQIPCSSVTFFTYNAILSLYGTGTESGEAIPQAVSGALSFQGSVLAWLIRVVSAQGTLSPAGAISRQIAKNVGGGFISFVGILYQKDFKLLVGTLTSSGALIKMTSKAVAGVLSFAGAISKLPGKVMTGAISPAGALTRNIYKTVAGAISPSGIVIATFESIGAHLVGNLTSAGTLVKQVSKNLAGDLTLAGGLTKGFFVAINGTLTSAGSVIRNTGKNLSGLLTSVGITTKYARKLMHGTLTITGLLQKMTSKIVSGALSLVGILPSFGRDLKVRLFHRPYLDMSTETKPYRDMSVESKDD